MGENHFTMENVLTKESRAEKKPRVVKLWAYTPRGVYIVNKNSLPVVNNLVKM